MRLRTIAQVTTTSTHMGENPCVTKQSLYPLSLNDHKVLIQRTPEELPFVPRPVHQPQFTELEQALRTTIGRAASFNRSSQPSTNITAGGYKTGASLGRRSQFAKFFFKLWPDFGSSLHFEGQYPQLSRSHPAMNAFEVCMNTFLRSQREFYF